MAVCLDAYLLAYLYVEGSKDKEAKFVNGCRWVWAARPTRVSPACRGTVNANATELFNSGLRRPSADSDTFWSSTYGHGIINQRPILLLRNINAKNIMDFGTKRVFRSPISRAICGSCHIDRCWCGKDAVSPLRHWPPRSRQNHQTPRRTRIAERGKGRSHPVSEYLGTGTRPWRLIPQPRRAQLPDDMAPVNQPHQASYGRDAGYVSQILASDMSISMGDTALWSLIGAAVCITIKGMSRVRKDGTRHGDRRSRSQVRRTVICMSFKYPDVRLALSMTTNKTQGQSLKYVGVNLRGVAVSFMLRFLELQAQVGTVCCGRRGRGEKGYVPPRRFTERFTERFTYLQLNDSGVWIREYASPYLTQ
jgi:hypothetical protein